MAQLSQWTTPGTSGEPARVTVGLELASQGSSGPLGALEGRLRWDADELAYVGEVPELPTLSAVNRSRAQEGEMRFAMIHAGGIPALAAVWVFEVLSATGVGPQGAARVDLELTRGYDLDYAERAVTVVRSGRAKASLPSPDGARHLDLDAWAEMLGSDRQTIPRVPGAAEVYGDATQDGLVQAVDALWTLSATVGNIECILGSDDPGHDCLAANVHPFNEPGLGEPSDPCPPGLDSCSSWTRTIQSVDALAILDEAVGNDPPIAGDSIPSLVTGDTVTLSGVITGTRTLDADSVYQLQGAVAVGEESDGWVGASGTLVIPAGTQIIAGSGASLSITAAGTIQANGTELDPVVFECADAMPEPGCWDGIVLAGTAPVNDGTPAEDADSVSGWTKMSGDLRSWMGHHFGGSNGSHDGGTLEHVIVSHAGGSGAALTLGGVGDGTTVRFVQAHASSGAGLQVIGGTVRASHLLTTANQGDYLRVTNGHQGSLQFVTVQMEPDTSDLVGVRVTNGPDDPDVTPRTSPELWNLTVIGGTAFTEQHTALAFEDAGATVRNALLVKTGVGLTADAGACDRLDVDSLDVDHTSFLGSLEPLAGSCPGDLETALAAGSVEGQDGSLLYQAHLTNPFDGELLDDRGGGDTISAATPSSPLDPTGDYLGSSQPGGDQIPWYTGWMRTWERASGFANLPELGNWNPPEPDTIDVLSPDSLPIDRSRATVGLDTTASPAELADLFVHFGLRVIGTVGGYVVQFPDPGPDFSAVVAVIDSIDAHPATSYAAGRGGVWKLDGLYPEDGAGGAEIRADWHPDSTSAVGNWKAIRAPQAWYCANGTYAESKTSRVAILERGFTDFPGGGEFNPDVDHVVMPGTTPSADSSYMRHGLAVAGQIAAIGDNGIGIAGMNWATDLSIVTPGTETDDDELTIDVLEWMIGAATGEGANIVSSSLAPTSAHAGGERLLASAFVTFLSASDKNIVIQSAGSSGQTQNLLDVEETDRVLVRALASLPPQFADRILLVTQSEDGAGFPGANYYEGPGVPRQIAAPAEHSVLTPTGVGVVEGSSYGTPMVAGLASLLYQMDSTLTGEEVVDLILDGAAAPDVLGALGLIDQVTNLPPGVPQNVYELDAFSSMQLLSRTRANTPVCGLDVYQLESNGKLRIDRETPQDYTIHDTLPVGPVSVAPGGRSIAAGNHLYDHQGSLQASFPSYGWVEFMESREDTAFYGSTSVPDAFTATLVRGTDPPKTDTISGVQPFIPRPVKLSPDGTRIQYVTRDSTLNGCAGGTATEFEFQIHTASFPSGGSSTIGPLLRECETVTVDHWEAVQWNEFGDGLITTWHTDSDLTDPMTVRHHSRPLSGSATEVYELTSADRPVYNLALGQIPGSSHYKAMIESSSSGSCSLRSGSLLLEDQVASKTIPCPVQGGQWSIPGLAPRPTVAIPERPN